MDTPLHRVTLELDQFSASDISAAVLRLGYLHPKWKFEINDTFLVASAPLVDSRDDILQEVQYAIYREKILSTTMDMRRDLLCMLAQS